MNEPSNRAKSFADADRWDREQIWAMTPDERIAISRALRDRVYGNDCADVREAERDKQSAPPPPNLGPS